MATKYFLRADGTKDTLNLGSAVPGFLGLSQFAFVIQFRVNFSNSAIFFAENNGGFDGTVLFTSSTNSLRITNRGSGSAFEANWVVPAKFDGEIITCVITKSSPSTFVYGLTINEEDQGTVITSPGSPTGAITVDKKMFEVDGTFTAFDFYLMELYDDLTAGASPLWRLDADAAPQTAELGELWDTQNSVQYSIPTFSNNAASGYQSYEDNSTPNTLPTIVFTTSGELETGVAHQLNPTVTDPDVGGELDQTLDFAWSQLQGDAGAFSALNIRNPTFTPSSTLEPVTLRLAVSDGVGTTTIEQLFTVIPQASLIKPVITVPEQSAVIRVGDAKPQWNPTSTDNIDDNATITAAIVISGNDYDETVVGGPHTVSFNVTDSDGNAADTVTRTVEVREALAGEEFGLQLGTVANRWLSIPQYTFPVNPSPELDDVPSNPDNIVTISADFLINKQVTGNQLLFRLRNNPYEISFSMDETGLGTLTAQSATDTETIVGGSFGLGGRYTVTASLNVSNNNDNTLTLAINGTPIGTASLSTSREFAGITTGTGTDGTVGNSYNIFYLNAILYSFDINGEAIYSTDLANGTGDVVPDSEGGASATIINPSTGNEQWIADATIPVITVTPGNQTIPLQGTVPTFNASSTGGGPVIQTGTVNVNVAGNYQLAFNSTNTDGSQALEVIRTVTVESAEIPTGSTKRVTFSIPDLARNVAGLYFSITPLGGGVQISRGTLNTAQSTTEINLDAVTGITDAQRVLLFATNKDEDNESTAIAVVDEAAIIIRSN